MKPTHRRPLSRLAIQLTAVALIGGLSFAMGFRQGARSNEEPISSVSEMEDPTADSRPSVETPPLESKPEPLETVQIDTPPEASTDWRARGYDAGLIGFEEALLEAKSLKGPEQALFISGLFTNIATFSSPNDALTIATAQEGSIRDFALKTLVAEWTGTSEPGSPNPLEDRGRRILNMSGRGLGLEVSLASLLARSDADPAITQAWMDAFADNPGRSEIAARLVPGQPDFDPDNVFAIADEWTDWEKDRFSNSLLTNWAERDPNGLIERLDTMKQAESRLLAIEAISAALALKGTAGALDWVESLANSRERDAGLQAVYEATPKGIGAMLSTENGFPKIGAILPGGALESTNIREGDLIVQSRETDGAANELYGIPLGETVGFLRGAPGSSVEILVLRKNETTGELEEHSVTVERDLLILDPDARRKDIDSP